MRPSLQLKMGQQLTMTPQLQQAIRLLQLSTLDLQQEIQQALDSNPLLELEDESQDPDIEPGTGPLDATVDKNIREEADLSQNIEPTHSAEIETSEALQNENLQQELAVDVTWDEMVSAGVSPTGANNSYEEAPVYQGETTETIQDYLLWQMELTPFSDTDKAIAMAIIDGIDDKGFLTQPLVDILDSIGDNEIEIEEVEAVLKRIQFFDPIGVASRNLQECLSIQLLQFRNPIAGVSNAQIIINNHIELLANRDFRSLMRKMKIKEPELKNALDIIKTLNPIPANSVIPQETTYVIPDVSVTKKKDRWMVELNPQSVPKIRVNQHYASMGKQGNSSDAQFIRSHLQEAKWFIKSVESRNDTLLTVASCIVEQQQDFFEHGEEAMKPMVLNDVAEIVDMHESTISRVTTQKYMHTPRGIFELKYFFSSHVNTDTGGECSSTAIRALIKKLVAAENPSKPLSDSKISELLSEQGIQVARRTIAKYRESLSIPPSNKRKSLL